MRITRLFLSGFRNYQRALFQFDAPRTALIGPNAAGKTNLLEAVYLLSLGKSFRARSDREMIMFNRDAALVRGDIQRHNSHDQIEMILLEKGKKARYNGEIINKQSDLAGRFNAVLFCPDDLLFIKGAPRFRRRLVDLELAKLYPRYITLQNDYLHDLKERNSYYKRGRRDDIYWEIITARMARSELEIAKMRNDFITLLNQSAASLYEKMSGAERMNIRYQTFFSQTDGFAEVMAFYEKEKEREYRYQTTLYGIHKDDFPVFLDDQPAAWYASQGQQRSLVLAIKLALLELIKKNSGEFPVLLLDDVLSELDETRQHQLFALVDEGVQMLMTSASDIHIAGMEKINITKKEETDHG